VSSKMTDKNETSTFLSFHPIPPTYSTVEWKCRHNLTGRVYSSSIGSMRVWVHGDWLIIITDWFEFRGKAVDLKQYAPEHAANILSIISD
jgi:hypothetical protein